MVIAKLYTLVKSSRVVANMAFPARLKILAPLCFGLIHVWLNCANCLVPRSTSLINVSMVLRGVRLLLLLRGTVATHCAWIGNARAINIFVAAHSSLTLYFLVFVKNVISSGLPLPRSIPSVLPHTLLSVSRTVFSPFVAHCCPVFLQATLPLEWGL